MRFVVKQDKETSFVNAETEEEAAEKYAARHARAVYGTGQRVFYTNVMMNHDAWGGCPPCYQAWIGEGRKVNCRGETTNSGHAHEIYYTVGIPMK